MASCWSFVQRHLASGVPSPPAPCGTCITSQEQRRTSLDTYATLPTPLRPSQTTMSIDPVQTQSREASIRTPPLPSATQFRSKLNQVNPPILSYPDISTPPIKSYRILVSPRYPPAPCLAREKKEIKSDMRRCFSGSPSIKSHLVAKSLHRIAATRLSVCFYHFGSDPLALFSPTVEYFSIAVMSGEVGRGS